jgi:hypothetical protein
MKTNMEKLKFTLEKMGLLNDLVEGCLEPLEHGTPFINFAQTLTKYTEATKAASIELPSVGDKPGKNLSPEFSVGLITGIGIAYSALTHDNFLRFLGGDTKALFEQAKDL